ncbi:MAG: hypothetical protein M3033_15010 [Acidobacteriota bacterium]|nr:hypothetical protein [Acidobacteriota bacterium]
MNTKKLSTRTAVKKFQFLNALALLVCCAVFASSSFAQTAGGTQIVNQASATYSDGTGGTYSTVSNTVTVTVANVSGLTITPDAGSHASVVPGQSNVIYSFRVTNTGNFADQVRFLASGQSIQLSGAATVSAAVIDVDGSGTINAGDTDVLTNAADVVSASIAQNGFIDVLVSVNVSNSATPSSVISVQLGDAATGSPTFDNQAANNSIHEVRTVSTASVNGLREARGDMSATVETDAQLVLSLTAPAGPVALGSNVNYSWALCNTGLRAASSITLTNAPAGSNSGVFIIAPIPVGTALATGQTFPAGTLYSTSALSVSPLLATYTTTAPADLTTVRRMAFKTGASLAAAGCATAIPMQVTITTTDATLDIFEIGDAFANNSVGGQLTDQSGDSVANKGDGNADFNEPVQGGTVSPTQGFQQRTLLTRTGSALIGPLGAPAAIGPSSTNDDYTNRSVTTGIAGVAFGGVTTASGVVVYSNTLRNNGNADDTFVITVPSAAAGFTVEISLDGGTTYTTMTGSNSVSAPVSFSSNRNILVRVTAPAGTAVLAGSGFNVVVRSTSTVTPSAYNETIDRLYTGFLRMDKSAVVINSTGVGAPTDAVPGAVIEYTIVYNNLATTGGTGNSTLSVSNLVITENGSVAPNNWAATTDQVVGSASDTRGGTIVGDAANSTVLTNTVPTLAPQQSGTFKFRRVIR